MLVEGLNRIRTLWSSLLNAAELGTGNTQETAQDIDLETPISSETTNITASTADQFLAKEARFYGTSAGGQGVKEMIWKTQSPELAASRVTFASTTWDTTSDMLIETRWFIQARR